jgi:hypothetical protein
MFVQKVWAFMLKNTSLIMQSAFPREILALRMALNLCHCMQCTVFEDNKKRVFTTNVEKTPNLLTKP